MKELPALLKSVLIKQTRSFVSPGLFEKKVAICLKVQHSLMVLCMSDKLADATFFKKVVM